MRRRDGYRYRATHDEFFAEMAPSHGELSEWFTIEEREAISEIFEAPFFGDERSINGAALFESCRRILFWIDQDDRLKTRFLLTYDIVPGVQIRRAERADGIQINGKYFDVEAGMGRCRLAEKVLIANNHYVAGKVEDISDRDEITIDTGPLKIARTKTDHREFVQLISSIAAFAGRHRDETIFYSIVVNMRGLRADIE